MATALPDGEPALVHDTEGPDDMAFHARSVLASNSLLTSLVSEGKLMLGTWQGIYLYEHRHAGHERSVVVNSVGIAPAA